MDVERNAARVLQYLYVRRFNRPEYDEIQDTVRMEEPELVRALEFLDDHDAVRIQQSVAGRPIEVQLTQDGMELVRDDDRFRAIFDEGTNLEAVKVRYEMEDEDEV